MSEWKIEPPPPTKLGRYRQLAPRAGVHVSPIALGGMSIGDKWAQYGMGAMDKTSSFRLLDAYYDAGGNFIDTSNNYQDGSSEMFIGEWMEKRGIRDQIVLASKFSTNFHHGDESYKQKVSFQGNHVKSMHLSLEASLKKLGTSYLDIFYVHWYDSHTSVEEIMDGLHTLIMARKVLYLGISDTPAWVVSKANMYARAYGKTPFVVYQGAWSILERDLERDILPMCRAEGLAVVPWNTLAGGHIRTDEEEERRRKSGEQGRMLTGSWERTEDEKKMCKALGEVAKEVGAEHISAVALAYVMQKQPFVFPSVGGRKVEQLAANLEALDIALTVEHMRYLEGVLPFDIGWPHNMLGTLEEYTWFIKMNATYDAVPVLPAIRPRK